MFNAPLLSRRAPLRPRTLAIIGALAGVIAGALTVPSCSLSRQYPRSETPEYEVEDGMFAEPAAPEPPSGGCEPTVDPPVYFAEVVKAMQALQPSCIMAN